MNDQLALLAPGSRADRPTRPADRASRPGAGGSWELDDHTRQVGRQGLAAARQALRQASARRAA